jgi:hypothetical protein
MAARHEIIITKSIFMQNDWIFGFKKNLWIKKIVDDFFLQISNRKLILDGGLDHCFLLSALSQLILHSLKKNKAILKSQ